MGYENSGRRPQPTALTVLRGNPSKKKLNPHEPVPPAGEVVKPGGLSPGAAGVWDRLAPLCLAMGTLTVVDVTVFATLCEVQGTLERAAGLKGSPETLDAAIALEKTFAPIARPYYALFGLEPVSRARIAVPKADAAPSKWTGLK
jgi:hypothetical protein